MGDQIVSISARAAGGAAYHKATRPKTNEDWEIRIALSNMQHEMDMIAQGIAPASFPQREVAIE